MNLGEGRRGKEGRQGGVVLRAKLSRVFPARLREEGGICKLSYMLREFTISIQK